MNYFYFAVLSLCLLAVVTTEAFRQKTPQGQRAVARKCKHSSKLYNSSPLFLSETVHSKTEDALKNICVLVVADESDDGAADEFLGEARTIADSLGIPLLTTAHGEGVGEESCAEFSHALRLVPYEYNGNGNDNELSTFALAIEPIGSDAPGERKGRRKQQQQRKPKKPKLSSSSAFFVDLCPPSNSKAGRRASGASGTADLLVKAVGPRKGLVDPTNGIREGAVVWDLTAGLGQDSLVLARNGAKKVRMVERHPVVAALLEDAMRRLELLAMASTSQEGGDTEDPSKALFETLDLSIGEGRDVLRKEDCSGCDVVYLDPMFPPRQKQSAVKKGMSILHGLLETHVVASSNSDEDEERRCQEEQDLLSCALDVARLRVVVKRPVKAPPLGDGSTKPSYGLTGSVNRWDVYVQPPPRP
jgi:16S rRNA (guanine1516-N2)-methyltransferase